MRSVPGSIATSAAQWTEVIRLDEEPVLKTGGDEESFVSSSPAPSGRRPDWWLPLRKKGSSSNRKMLASHARDPGAIPGGSTQHQDSPVAQRQRQLPYKETIGGSSPPGITEGNPLNTQRELKRQPIVLAEQSGVLATLSRWRSWVRIPSGTLSAHGRTHSARYANGKATKLKPS